MIVVACGTMSLHRISLVALFPSRCLELVSRELRFWLLKGLENYHLMLLKM